MKSPEVLLYMVFSNCYFERVGNATETLTTFLLFNSAQTEAIYPPEDDSCFAGGLSPNRINGLPSYVHNHYVIRPLVAVIEASQVNGSIAAGGGH